MPSLGDSVFIFILALMLFGPKKLPQLARQLGKLMAEFRKASNEFRMQMEDELRIEEQKEHQKKVDALAPPPSSTPNPDIPTEDPPHPHMPAVVAETSALPEPIAESGELKMMPPSTGLPVESSARSRSYEEPASIPEHSMAGEHLTSSNTGMSSDEPAAEVAYVEQAPDRGQPVMVGEGERATHA